jgi:transcriptional regulator with XRE-family HTH domain
MIGDRIRDLRNQHRLSQTQLSKIIHVSQQTITKWETGKAEPSSNAISALADYFHVSADYLLGRETKNSSNHVDLARDPVVLSFNGEPLSQDDLDIIKAVLKWHDEK